MRSRRPGRRTARILCAVLLSGLLGRSYGQALFSEDDTPESVAALYSWDEALLDAESWDVTYAPEDLAGTDYAAVWPDGFTVQIPRASDYAADYFSDLVETTTAYLGLDSSGGSGADIVALAVSEYEACQREAEEGRYGERRETNHDNCTLYTRYWGLNAPWCAMFISWLADRCGYLDGHTFPDHVIYRCGLGPGGFLQWFLDNGNPVFRIRDTPVFGSHTYTPVPGDILIFGRTPGGHEHIGIVTEAEGDRIVTVEGNVRDRVLRIEYRAETFARWGWADAYVIHVEYPLPAGSGGLSEEDVSRLWNSLAAPTREELARLARDRYGYDETALRAMLAYTEGEAGGWYAGRGEPYIEYLYGSIAVNQMSLFSDGDRFLRWMNRWDPDGYYSWRRLQSRADRPSEATRKALYLALLSPHPEAYYGYGTGTAPADYIYTFRNAAGEQIWIRPRSGG